MAAVAALSLLVDSGAEAWPVLAPPVRSAWCCENLRLPSETTADPGRYSLAGREYLAGILDAVDDPEIRKITFVGASQIGKTLAVKAIILSQGEVARAPMMFAGPDQLYVRENREEIYRMAELSSALYQRIPPKRLRNDRSIDLERCLVYLAWSGSTQRLSGRACKLVLCSEADRWEHSTSLAEERTKSFPDNGCVLLEGTPIGASPVLDDSYAASDRRSFRVPCPHCGHYQELRFFPHRTGPRAGRGGVAGLKNDRGDWLRPADARLAAHYLCEQCGRRIESAQKTGMVARGVWTRDGQSVNRDGKVSGTPQNPGRHAGFRVNSLYSPTISFGDAAERYLLLRDQPGGLEAIPRRV